MFAFKGTLHHNITTQINDAFVSFPSELFSTELYLAQQMCTRAYTAKNAIDVVHPVIRRGSLDLTFKVTCSFKILATH